MGAIRQPQKPLTELQEEFCKLHVFRKSLGKTHADIAEELSVSVRVLYKWLEKDEIKRRVAELEKAASSGDFLRHLSDLVKVKALEGKENWIKIAVTMAKELPAYFGINVPGSQNTEPHTNAEIQEEIEELERELIRNRQFMRIEGKSGHPLVDAILQALEEDRTRLSVESDPQGITIHKELQESLHLSFAAFPGITMEYVNDYQYLHPGQGEEAAL